MANIPTAEVARIEPRSCFLDPACSVAVFFMFPPHSLSIFDCRLPIDVTTEQHKSAIGNRQFEMS
jgi:hypothetical protein